MIKSTNFKRELLDLSKTLKHLHLSAYSNRTIYTVDLINLEIPTMFYRRYIKINTVNTVQKMLAQELQQGKSLPSFNEGVKFGN